MKVEKGIKRVLAKIILVGNAGVGKTVILNNYIYRRNQLFYHRTVGADFFTIEKLIDNHQLVANFWDTEGIERLPIGNIYYRGSEACILVFDLSNKHSFDSLEYWYNTVLRSAKPNINNNDMNNENNNNNNNNKFTFLVLGNKSDKVNERVVSKEVAEQWCEEKLSQNYNQISIKYIEISAMDLQSTTIAFNDYLFPSIVQSIVGQNNNSKNSNVDSKSSDCCIL